MKLITENIWKYIRNCVKENTNNYVAVAYLGKDANKHLPLNAGDILVVDASENSIKAGRTNPFELKKYIKKGVEIFTYENLHAKVFVLGQMTIIGSTNVSNHSANILKECVVEIKDSKTVSEARGFIKSLALEPLSPKYIESLIKIYNPTKNIRNKKTTPITKSLWIQNLEQYELTYSEQNAYEKGKNRVLKKIINTRKYEVGSIRYKFNDNLLKRIEIGDLIIQILDKKVYPPARILETVECSKDNSVIILLEQLSNPNTISKSEFIKKMNKFGFKQKFRRFTKNNDKNIILGLWKN